MGKITQLVRNIAKSGFVRSVFLRVLSIFMVVSLAIAGVAFFSFASEIRKNILADRQTQLNAVEDSISKRMDEISSIAYKISIDKDFFLEPVPGDITQDYEISQTLSRYLVGNSFIEHLAFYRRAEPDTIYISSGVRSLSEFFSTSFGMSKEAVDGAIQGILSCNRTEIKSITYGNSRNSYFAYLYPLPQLSERPQAYVLMLIPSKQVAPLLETLFMNSSGEVAVFDSNGGEIYRAGTLSDGLPLSAYAKSASTNAENITYEKTDYVVQKAISGKNGWTYVSAIRKSDMLSGLANRQLTFIILLLLLLFIAIIAMLACIVAQYMPISNLAAGFVRKGDKSKVIDERVLLSDTIATLQGDSAQKQKFENAYREAEAASKAKSAFLSSMSHDIRTPMNAIIGMTAIAERHADDPEYVRDCLQKVEVSSQYLLDIINNVLDMSRIESGRVTLSEDVIDLKVLADGLVTLIGPSAEAKSLRLLVDVEPLARQTVIGDNIRLTQVFMNILSNSVKFTPEGGAIEMHIRQAPSDSPDYGCYVFTCSDTGIGMSPEFVGQVFDTFSRADAAAVLKTEGTGLGMAIAKNLIELMGGTIVCESELNKGTAFTVTLRMKLTDTKAKAAPVIAQAESSEIIDLTGKHILLAEDNTINRVIARKILGETQAEVAEAVNGKEAVELFESKPEGYFDIILMDIQMPVMNGYEATAAIRSGGRADAHTVPIFAMTANTFDEDVRQVRDAGMNGHIGKPYKPDMLYNILKNALIK